MHSVFCHPKKYFVRVIEYCVCMYWYCYDTNALQLNTDSCSTLANMSNHTELKFRKSPLDGAICRLHSNHLIYKESATHKRIVRFFSIKRFTHRSNCSLL